MLIKVDSEYLDFNGDIEVERQANLFEDVTGVNGDFSYSFSIPKTINNLRILGIQTLNQTPTYNLKKEATLYSDSGEDIYTGFLRVERIGLEIECSFFAGNNNWFEALNVNLRDFNYKYYELEYSNSNIQASWSASSGVVFPLVDRGTLYQRRTNSVYFNDFQPFIYVKDVVKTFLSQSEGIKLEGDLVRDPIYNSLITTNNGLSGVQDKLDTVSVYAAKTSSQSISSTSYSDITFDDSSTEPYFEGSDNNWTSHSYTATKELIKAKVTIYLSLDETGGGSFSGLVGFVVKVLKNSDTIYEKEDLFNNTYTLNKEIEIKNIDEGDVIKVQIKKLSGSNNFNILTGSSFRFDAIKLRNVYPSQLLPDLTASEYLTSIFARFGVFATYDAKKKIINTKFLNNIKRAEPIDLSEYIESAELSYNEFVDDYSQTTKLLYGEQGVQQVTDYNSLNSVPYGAGSININNEFLEAETDFLELDEVAPFQVPVEWLGFSLPLLDYCEFTVDSEETFSAAADDGNGYVELNLGASTNISDDDLIRIVDSTVSTYDGVHRVTSRRSALGVEYATIDLFYDATASGTIEILSIDDVTNEDQITLINLPNVSLSTYTDTPNFIWVRPLLSGSRTSSALAYFWLPQVNKPINGLKQALYFDPVNDVQAYQQGLKEAYFDTAERVLNDPVTVISTMYLPEKVYRDIDFLRPARIKTAEFNGLFLINRITGYKGSHLPCEVELIKLS